MRVPQYEARFSVPDLAAGEIVRSRLSTLLDRSADVPLTIVRGPGGSGKTVAVAAWARGTDAPVGWLTLGTADREPRRLAEGLWRAAELPSEQRFATGTAEDDGAESLMATLAAAVAAVGDDLTVVVDGAEEISGSPAEAVVADLVRYLPPNLHLVFLTDGPVPLPLGRLRLAGRLLELGGEDLRLRPDETAALLASSLPDADPDLGAEVHHVSEGFVAIVAAAARASARDTVVSEATAPTWAEATIDAVLERLRPDLRQLVSEVAPLPLLTAALCNGVTGRRDGAALLGELEQVSLILVRVDDHGPTYRLHRMVHRVLSGRMADDDPDRLVATHRAAAHWLESHGEPVAAVAEWLAAGDEVQAWHLISHHSVKTYFDGHRDVVEGWVAHLTADTARDDPMRAIDRAALMLMVGRPDDAARWAEQADRSASSDADAPAIAALARFMRAQSHFMWGELDEALELHLDIDRGEIPPPFRHLGAAVAVVECLVQVGRFDEARVAFSEMAPWASFEGEMSRVMVPGVLASLATQQGYLGDALDFADETLSQAETITGIQATGTESSHLAVGVALLEQGRVVEAEPSLLAAQRIAARTGLVHIRVRAAIALAQAHCLQGRVAEAFAGLGVARRPLHVRPTPGRVLGWISRAEARLLLLTGDASEAQAMLDELPEDGEPESTILRAWAALALGDPAAAGDLLAPELGPAASVRNRVEAELLRSQCVRDPARVFHHVRRAVHRGAPDRYVTVFLDHRSGIVHALHDLFTREPSPYLADLLVLVDEGPGPSPIEPLTERELDVLTALMTSRSTPAIATEMGVTLNTLKTHIKAIYRKLDVTSRDDAVRRAIVVRLIGPEATGGRTLVTPREAEP